MQACFYCCLDISLKLRPENDLRIDTGMLICEIADVRFHVGDVIRKLRQDRNWTVEDLARKAGVNKMTVSGIERGESNYRRQTLELIAAALKSTVDELHSQLNLMASFETRPSDVIGQDDLNVLRRWHRFPREKRAVIDALESVNDPEDLAAVLLVLKRLADDERREQQGGLPDDVRQRATPATSSESRAKAAGRKK